MIKKYKIKYLNLKNQIGGNRRIQTEKKAILKLINRIKQKGKINSTLRTLLDMLNKISNFKFDFINNIEMNEIDKYHLEIKIIYNEQEYNYIVILNEDYPFKQPTIKAAGREINLDNLDLRSFFIKILFEDILVNYQEAEQSEKEYIKLILDKLARKTRISIVLGAGNTGLDKIRFDKRNGDLAYDLGIDYDIKLINKLGIDPYAINGDFNDDNFWRPFKPEFNNKIKRITFDISTIKFWDGMTIENRYFDNINDGSLLDCKDLLTVDGQIFLPFIEKRREHEIDESMLKDKYIERYQRLGWVVQFKINDDYPIINHPDIEYGKPQSYFILSLR